MHPLQLLVILVTPISILHVARRLQYVRLPTHFPSPTVLPLSSRTQRKRQTHVALSRFNLRVRTTFPDEYGEIGQLWNVGWLRIFYELGTAVSVFGMAAGVAGLWFMCIRSLTGGLAQPLLAKRGVSEALADSSTWDIHPIIPGLTVPLHHLPPIVFALLLAQAWHEAGHAFAAAASSIPLLSAGLTLTLAIFPTMHVELGQSRSPPSLNLSSRPASSTVSAVKSFTDAAYTNARVAAAGPFHNVILLLFAVSAAAAVRSTGLVAGRRMDHGLLVTALDPDSPLSAYLSIGDVLTGVDDVDLAYMPRMGTADEFEEAEDRWTAYLTGFPPSMSPLGWCARVNSDEGMGRITACCPPIADTDPNISCFNELSPSRSMHCFDPLTLLTQTKVQRCDAPVACKDGVAEAAATYLSGEWACVRPHADEHLLRIYVSNGQTISIGQDRGIRVVLWRGPGIEVFEQVQVSRYAPPWLLEILPSSIVLFLTYIPSVTLSLFFFNLLPLTPLDGGALLRALLDWFFPPDPHSVPVELGDLEGGRSGTAGRRQSRQRARWKQLIASGANSGTFVLMAVYVMLSGVRWFRAL